MPEQASAKDLDTLVSSLTSDTPTAEPAEQEGGTRPQTPARVVKPIYDWSLVLDLDYAAVDGAEALYQAAEKVLEGRDLALDSARFVRFLLGEPAAAGLTALMNHLHQPKDAVPSLVQELLAAFETRILDASPRPAALELIRRATTENGHVVALTGLSERAAERLLAAVGLPADTTTISEQPDGFGYQTTEVWSKAQQATALSERHCMAVVGTADNARSALMANMNVAALVGARTEAQDFGGVDCISNGSEAHDADAVLELLQSRL